jgi:hypothetical protein
MSDDDQFSARENARVALEMKEAQVETLRAKLRARDAALETLEARHRALEARFAASEGESVAAEATSLNHQMLDAMRDVAAFVRSGGGSASSTPGSSRSLKKTPAETPRINDDGDDATKGRTTRPRRRTSAPAFLLVGAVVRPPAAPEPPA